MTPVVRTALPVVVTFILAFGVGAAGAALLRGDGDDRPASAATATAAVPGTTSAPAPSAAPSSTSAPASTTTAPAAAPVRALVPAAGRSAFAAQFGTSGVAAAVAPVGGGVIQTFGDRALASQPGGPAWSTMKLALVTALVRDHGTPAQLTPQQRQLAVRALTISDNDAAAAIFDELQRTHGGLVGASASVTGLLRRAGDTVTEVSTTKRDNPGAPSTYGQTPWSLAASVRFVRSLVRGCLLGASGTQYVRGLMARVSAERPWGIGGAGFGDAVAFKGGWGPEPSGAYDARQVGVVGRGAARAVVAVFARGANRDEAFARATAVANWLRAHMSMTGRRPAARCG